ncbi:pentatricopeptide repeat-containing protein At1g71210, mitochondrial [Aegilops tauschii subsp. strangulata]|uniref:Pentacotripeptide-repeat region of PRORP domain-containing protein n=4 Tax=Triticinae TaxID=1648030 RepID=A0A453N3T8_AEGTS|nr:pentatricopeptide repeat-containing protein At1g71210, mitochondrial [Aegilops tauschii subsp. strangulata]XP_040247834.1 pentatricopeptide repeat-containing protein At1g71210, mitochondrial [Aegilops tauschii subsp. strangulata]XP_044418428.1 pentatricopeptide repeat-containing protein At1g71210, mitochondrial-like [Triticum aestivum]XP_044418429.1 pentatricopeptide repeat-containing protein At1g71210, mitochondrial-like [Triticum aestivum]
MPRLLAPLPSRSRRRRLLAILSNTFSASTASPHRAPPPPPPPLPQLSPLLPRTAESYASISEAASDIAVSFRDWFLAPRAAEPLAALDLIYEALASDDAAALEALPLSEELVLSVLRHRPRRLPDGDAVLLLRLKFFDWSGRRPHYLHTRAVYHAVFRLLSRARRASVVLDWLRLFTTTSASTGQPRFHQTLVVGYAVAGDPQRGLSVLGRMRFRGMDLDAVSSRILLNSLVDASFHDLADSFARNLAASPVATCIRIKSLCRRARFSDATALLDTLPFAEASRGPAAGSIVTEFCRRGRFDEAAQIVGKFSSCDVYGAWIHGLIEAGMLDTTLQFLSDKKEAEGYIPDGQRYDKLVHRLLRKNRLGEVYDLLVEMMEEGIAPGRSTMNAALCFFCKAGLVEVAMHLYRSRLDLGINPNKDVYNNLIRALCRGGATEEACLVLEQSMEDGYFPGRQTFAMFANVLCQEGKLDKVRELLDRALKQEAWPMDNVLAKYLVALCKSGNVDEACKVPQIASSKNPAGLYRYESTYKSLIRALILIRRVDVLPRLILEMQDMGHIPTRSLYQSVVCELCELSKYGEVLELLENQLRRSELQPRVCYNYFISGAGHAKKADVAREVYSRMESAGIEPSVESNILLLMSYLRSKRIGDALTFFNFIHEKKPPGTKMYNVFISGLCEARKPEQAMVFWREARDKGLIPSIDCYEQLVLLLSSVQDYDSVVKIIDDFRETGRPVSAFLCNVLLLHTLRGSDLLKAWARSEDKSGSLEASAGEIKGRGAGRFLIGQLIELFASGIRNRSDLEVLEEGLEQFFPVDIYTYNMLLRGLSMAGRMDSACNMFERLCQRGYLPNRYTFDIMVHGFCKHGSRSEAERWMEAMYRNGFYPTWYTMRLYNNTSLRPHDQKAISFV